jgi:hypothetical protein
VEERLLAYRRQEEQDRGGAGGAGSSAADALSVLVGSAASGAHHAGGHSRVHAKLTYALGLASEAEQGETAAAGGTNADP